MPPPPTASASHEDHHTSRTDAALGRGLGRNRVARRDDDCAGTFARTFTPPVSTTAQTVTATSTDSYSTRIVGSTGTGQTSTTTTLSCVNITALSSETETITWSDTTTSTIVWNRPAAAGQTVVFTGTVTAGAHVGDTAAKVTSGTSYLASVGLCLLGTPISQTTGLIDSLILNS
jgi:hypothetical protein